MLTLGHPSKGLWGFSARLLHAAALRALCRVSSSCPSLLLSGLPPIEWWDPIPNLLPGLTETFWESEWKWSCQVLQVLSE